MRVLTAQLFFLGFAGGARRVIEGVFAVLAQRRSADPHACFGLNEFLDVLDGYPLVHENRERRFDLFEPFTDAPRKPAMLLLHKLLCCNDQIFRFFGGCHGLASSKLIRFARANYISVIAFAENETVLT